MTKTETQLRKAEDVMRFMHLAAEIVKRRDAILLRKALRAARAGDIQKAATLTTSRGDAAFGRLELEAEDQPWARGMVAELAKLELSEILPPAAHRELVESMRKVVPDAFRIVGSAYDAKLGKTRMVYGPKPRALTKAKGSEAYGIPKSQAPSVTEQRIERSQVAAMALTISQRFGRFLDDVREMLEAALADDPKPGDPFPSRLSRAREAVIRQLIGQA